MIDPSPEMEPMPEKYWIQGAVKHPGALRSTARSKYGSRAFTDRGTIKKEYLSRMSKERGKTGQRARLAITLRRMRQ